MGVGVGSVHRFDRLDRLTTGPKTGPHSWSTFVPAAPEVGQVGSHILLIRVRGTLVRRPTDAVEVGPTLAE